MFDFLVLCKEHLNCIYVTVSLCIQLCYSMFFKLFFQLVEHIHIMVSAEHHGNLIFERAYWWKILCLYYILHMFRWIASL